MDLSYTMRVLCVALMGLGIAHVLLHLALQLALPACTRILARKRARMQERFFFALLLLPPVAACLLTLLVIVPAFVAQENNHRAEETGLVCIAATAMLTVWYLATLVRSLLLTGRTRHFENSLRPTARPIAGQAYPTWSLPSARPLLALVGLLQPRILLSEDLLDAAVLPPDVLETALRHEQAHARNHDNWKLLAARLIPSLPLRSSRLPSLEETWQRYSEWAADDDAVAGDAESALLLAESLLFFARSASTSPQGILATSLCGSDEELSMRIGRLLAEEQPARICEPHAPPVALLVLYLLLLVSAGILFCLLHATESLLHFG